VLEAFLAVRRLRLEGGVELDRYYSGNLGWPGALALLQGQIDGDVVPQIVAALVRQLRESPAPPKPVFAGRTLHVALREERVEASRLSISPSAPICRCSIAWPRAVIGCRSGALRGPPAVGTS
jgi:hypothetical protein